MWKKIFVIAASVFLIASGMSAADRLAIAEPVAKGNFKPTDIEAVWGMLEGSVDGGYELISRSALKQMLTEIDLTASSDLMNLNSSQKAKMGQLKTVKYLLVPTIGTFGSRVTLSLLLLDASTGEIDPERKTSETVNSLDELADKLKDMLQEMGLGRAARKRGRSAILVPVIKAVNAPRYVGEEFNVRLEDALLEKGIKLQNLQSVSKILRKNKIDNLYEVEPSMYVRIGELLRVDYLIQGTVNRFSCVCTKRYIEVTRKYTFRCIGNIDGNIRIISAQTGNVAGSIPFRQKIDFDELDEDIETDDWTPTDYGKYMIERLIPALARKIVPRLK